MSEDLGIVNAFLRQHVADIDAGIARSLQDYQYLFPGHEALIPIEYDRLQAARTQRRSGPTPEPAVQLSSGRLGPYRILKTLGSGGQGVGHLAEDERLHRTGALKVLIDIGPAAVEGLQRFRPGAEVASRL